MRLTKTEETFVAVARFAEESGITFRQAVELRSLSMKAFRAGEYVMTCGQAAYHRAEDREIKAGKAVATFAEPLGLVVSWSGLWPTFTKDGRNHELPG